MWSGDCFAQIAPFDIDRTNRVGLSTVGAALVIGIEVANDVMDE